jgi:hypothetical protein
MKSYLGGKNKPQDVAKVRAAKNGSHDEFPNEDNTIMMIFSGTPTRPSRRKHKRILQEIYHNEPAMPSHLRWFETAVTYDRTDH